jgi:hypothetical protein
LIHCDECICVMGLADLGSTVCEYRESKKPIAKISCAS